MKAFEELSLYPSIKFDSKITTLILKLEHLRGYSSTESASNEWYVQLKSSFQQLEALSSSRIEGNITTIWDYSKKLNYPKKIKNLKTLLKFLISKMQLILLNKAIFH